MDTWERKWKALSINFKTSERTWDLYEDRCTIVIFFLNLFLSSPPSSWKHALLHSRRVESVITRVAERLSRQWKRRLFTTRSEDVAISVLKRISGVRDDDDDGDDDVTWRGSGKLRKRLIFSVKGFDRDGGVGDRYSKDRFVQFIRTWPLRHILISRMPVELPWIALQIPIIPSIGVNSCN